MAETPEEIHKKAEEFHETHPEVAQRRKEMGEKQQKEIETNNLIKEVISLLLQKQPREATESIVDYFLKHNYVYTLRDDKETEMWIYLDGIYVPQAKTYILEFCRKILGAAYTTHFGNEVVAKIATDTFITPQDFFDSEADDDKIIIENGILNLRTGILEEFTPDKFFFNKLPIKYDINAICPRIDSFFDDIFMNNEEDKKIAYELIGNCLLRNHKYNKATMCCGDGSNGKSVFMQLIKHFLGHENCVSIPLQQFDRDIFSKSELHKKLANIAGEIGQETLKDTNVFKEITGEDMISASRKFMTQLHFYSNCKQFFSANVLPITTDITFAFFRRWILLNFLQKFLPKDEWEKLNEKDRQIVKVADRNIIKSITIPEELSGLLNQAIEGIKRLWTNGNFSLSKSTEEIKNIWINKSDSFLAFCMLNVEESVEGSISKEDLRKKYNNYCSKYKQKPLSDKHIYETLVQIYGAYGTQDTSTTYDPSSNVKTSTRIRYWKGIKFKDNTIENK